MMGGVALSVEQMAQLLGDAARAAAGGIGFTEEGNFHQLESSGFE
jgi:hypothetical protein